MSGKIWVHFGRLCSFTYTSNSKKFRLMRHGVVEEIPFELYAMLFEWHFDVFGWLKKDLAINYNEYHHGNTH